MSDKFVLLVEGKDDKFVVENLLRRHSIKLPLIIKDKEGIDNLLETLDVELLKSDLQSLGIIVDADTDISARWTALRNILITSGYGNISKQIDPNGTIVTLKGKPTVGIWLMPNNNLNGMLEDFLQFLVPNRENNRLLEIAKTTVDSLPNQAELPEPERKFSSGHESKAIIHTWLAWQEIPGRPFGLAITTRFLDSNAIEAKQLVAWLSQLYQ